MIHFYRFQIYAAIEVSDDEHLHETINHKSDIKEHY